MADKPSQLQSVIRFQEAYMEQEKMHKRKASLDKQKYQQR